VRRITPPVLIVAAILLTASFAAWTETAAEEESESSEMVFKHLVWGDAPDMLSGVAPDEGVGMISPADRVMKALEMIENTDQITVDSLT
jgi:hypothetical protein